MSQAELFAILRALCREARDYRNAGQYAEASVVMQAYREAYGRYADMLRFAVA